MPEEGWFTWHILGHAINFAGKFSLTFHIQQLTASLVWFLCLMAYQLFRLFNAKAILQEEQ